MRIARAVMKKELITIGEEALLPEAIRLLLEHRISGLPVVTGEGVLVGILTEKDLLRVLYEEQGTLKTVGDLMTREIHAFQADDPLELVCDCLMANHFRRVPILEGDKLVGLISRADLMPTILEIAAENTQ